MRGRRIGYTLILLLMILHVWTPAFWRAGSAWGADAEAVSIPGFDGDLNQLISDDVAQRSKPHFLRLYRAQWQAQGMADKLARAVNAAFD